MSLHCKTRFAPSPTGLMHLGNARTALFSALLGDRFLLRIEDTDRERSRPEYVSQLLEDLHWLGLQWDEGPFSAEPEAGHFQSCRGSIYREYYDRLIAAGRAYPCFCSASELEVARKVQLASGRPPRYSGKCAGLTEEDALRLLEQGRTPSLRFRVPQHDGVVFEDGVRGPQRFATDDIGDFIIRRADGSPAFFFCNAIDDSLMGVEWVLRGEDHLSNTPRQILLLQALGLRVPRYAHIALILGDDGAPLSKRNGSCSIRELRDQGYFADAVSNMLARIGHHYADDSILPLARLREGFELGHVGKSPSRFDPAHLKHWQEEAVRHAGDEALQEWLGVETGSLVPPDRHPLFLDIVRSNCLFPADAAAWAAILFSDALPLPAEAVAAARAAGAAYFTAALAAYRDATGFDAFLAELKARSGVKGKQLYLPLRAALTGRFDGPELAKIHQALDPARFRQRLEVFASG